MYNSNFCFKAEGRREKGKDGTEIFTTAYSMCIIFRAMCTVNELPDFPFRFTDEELAEQGQAAQRILEAIDAAGLKNDFGNFIPQKAVEWDYDIDLMIDAILDAVEEPGNFFHTAEELFEAIEKRSAEIAE